MGFTDILPAVDSNWNAMEFNSGQWPHVIDIQGKTHVIASQDRGFSIDRNGVAYRRGLRPPLDAPTIEEGADGSPSGEYRFCIAWYSKDRQVISNPSTLALDVGPPITAYISVAGKSINVYRNQTPLDDADEWVIYVHEAEDANWRMFRTAPIADAYVNFNLGDEEYGDLFLAFPSDAIPLDNAFPPACNYGLTYGDRIVSFGQDNIRLDDGEIGLVHMTNHWTASNPFDDSKTVLKRGVAVLCPQVRVTSAMNLAGTERSFTYDRYVYGGKFNGAEIYRDLKLDDSGEKKYQAYYHISDIELWLAGEYYPPETPGSIGLTTKDGESIYWEVVDADAHQYKFYTANEIVLAPDQFWVDFLDDEGVCLGRQLSRARVDKIGNDGTDCWIVVTLELGEQEPGWVATDSAWATTTVAPVMGKAATLVGTNYLFFTRSDSGGPLDAGVNDEAISPATGIEIVPQLGNEMPVAGATYREALIIFTKASLIIGSAGSIVGAPLMMWSDLIGQGCIAPRSLATVSEDSGAARTNDIIFASDAGLLRFSGGGVINDTQRLGLTELWMRIKDGLSEAVGIWDRANGCYELSNIKIRERRPEWAGAMGEQEPDWSLTWDAKADQIVLSRYMPTTAYLEMVDDSGLSGVFFGDDLGFCGQSQMPTTVYRDFDPALLPEEALPPYAARVESDGCWLTDEKEHEEDDDITPWPGSMAERLKGTFVVVEDADGKVSVARVISGEATYTDDEYKYSRLQLDRRLDAGLVTIYPGSIRMEWFSGIIGAESDDLKQLESVRIRLSGPRASSAQSVIVTFFEANNERDIAYIEERGVTDDGDRIDFYSEDLEITKELGDWGLIFPPGMLSSGFLCRIAATAIERFMVNAFQVNLAVMGEDR